MKSCSLITAQATGGAVGETESRLDFDLQRQVVDKEQLTADLNALVERGLPITVGSITDAELDQNPDLVRTMSVQPPRGHGSVRTISIEDTDYAAETAKLIRSQILESATIKAIEISRESAKQVLGLLENTVQASPTL